MTMAEHTAIDDQALDWVIRLRTVGFADWEAFEAWLSVDPAHAAAYHSMAADDADMAELLASAPQPRPVVAMPARHRLRTRRWFGGAIAASIAVVGGFVVVQQRPDPYVIETAAGVPRNITLADGSRIDLNGGSRLTLDHKHPRQAGLDRGEVTFTVVHDAARPFRVSVGDAMLVDVGTVFNVTRLGGATTVGVAEGAVVYNPGREAVQLIAGEVLHARDGEGRIVVSKTAATQIASWRTGRLIYDGASLAQVAADLSRNLGVSVVADRDVAGRQFRGVISFGKDRSMTMAGLGPLLGVHVIQNHGAWRLSARPS